MNQNAIEVEGLTKVYGSKTVINDISFSVQGGEIFGLLGPNGAGKTTALEIIEGIRRPSSGTAKICGFDTALQASKVKPLIGVKLQSSRFFETMTVSETINLFRAYHGQNSRPAGEGLEEVGLSSQSRVPVRFLSGGQRQRLALALALVNDPKVIFLDEPTTGLDPQSRLKLWDIVERLKRAGKTIVLTTHHMEEAERLCDQVAIIDQGRLLGRYTPQQWKSEIPDLDATIKFRLDHDLEREPDLDELSQIAPFERADSLYAIKTGRPYQILYELLQWSNTQKLRIRDLSLREATLEDVFLHLTGRELRN